MSAGSSKVSLNQTVPSTAASTIDDPVDGPGQAFILFNIMEDLFDKLKLLRYDEELVPTVRLKPICRHYFAIATNPGEQFFMFISVAAWLVRKCGMHFDPPQEINDPNVVVNELIASLKTMGIPTDFQSNRLKSGCGDECVYVLDHLADATLKQTNFKWKIFTPPETAGETEEEEEAVAEEAEVTLERVEEEMIEELDDVSDDDDEQSIMVATMVGGRRDVPERHEEIMKPFVDPNEWQMEVERVLPQLRLTIRPDPKDWRSHLDQIHQFHDEMKDTVSAARTQLMILASHISSSMQSIASRETHFTRQLESLLVEYRSTQDALKRINDRYKAISGGVTERSRRLAQIADEVEQIKHEIDQRGSSMTDGTPLVSTKRAIKQVRAEMSQLDLRLGVALHMVLRHKMKERGHLKMFVHSDHFA